MTPRRQSGGLDLLATPAGRKAVFAALYMSEGAPIGYLWWALPTRMRAADVPLGDITALTAALTLPWALKFLWAPLIDIVRSRRWTLRSWIISAQIVMGLALLPLLRLSFQEHYGLVVLLLLLHAVAAATQDAAVDALCIATVPPSQRGSINGWMQAGMLTGRSLLGGAGLALAGWIGDRGLIVVLVAMIWLSLALVMCSRAPEPDPGPLPAAPRSTVLLARLRSAAAQRNTWLGLIFAGVAGAGFEAVGAVAGPFLIDRGVAEQDIGMFFSLVSVPCMIGGAFAGGLLCDRIGKRRAAAGFLALVALSVLGVAAAGQGQTTAEPLILAALALLYGSIGLFTTASYALFMDLTDPGLAATQFSAYMALTNVCESWSAFAVGRLVPALGYPGGFIAMAAASLLALPALGAMSPSRPPGRSAARRT